MKKDSFAIKEIKDKKIWEDFNLSCQNPAYFQSWNWGEVEKRKGLEIFRFGIYKNENLEGIFQIFEIRARRGHFLHIRQGPVLKKWESEIVIEIVKFIKRFALEKNVSFVRISPLLSESDFSIGVFKKTGFRDSPIHNVDAENRWVLNIDEDLPVLLSKMRKTTRYMVKKGEGMKINITCSQDIKNVNEFLDIYKETAKNKKFVPHSLIKEEFEEFKKDNKSFIYLAMLDAQILAGALITYYGSEAIYRHGATSFAGRNTPASYYLQWQAISDAKKNGLLKYNFWGIAKTDNHKHPWHGLSQFKKGFGGYQVDFVHSMDLPIKKTYWISFLIDYYTKVKKGYNV